MINAEIETNIRDYLKSEFHKRLDKNPSYSLRSFAKALDIAPGTLYQILNGQRPITLKRMTKLADRLEMSTEELMQASIRKNNNLQFASLSEKAFSVMANWYCDAILELMRMDDFQQDIQWISKQLNLNINIIKLAIEDMINLEVILVDDNDRWVNNLEHSLMEYNSTSTSTALRKYQKELLKKSSASIDTIKRGVRDHSSFVFAMDKALLPEVNERIRNFQKELFEYIEENSTKKDHLHATQFSSFPLIENLKNRGVKK